MTTETRLTPAGGTALAPAASYQHLFVPGVSYKLLLAIENDDNAPAAIRLTAALGHRGAEPSVLRTLELMSPAAGANAGEAMFAYMQTTLAEEFYQGQEQIIRGKIEALLGRDPTWPVKTVVGDPPATIVFEAEQAGADLLVMGINRHGRFAQALGENTATRVMSKASMPILGVRPDSNQLPRQIMVATDFGNASWEAAHIAANLLDPDGAVILVHVTLPSPVVEEGDEGAAFVQREGIEHVFEKLANEIKIGKSIRVETITRTGDAGTELLAAAEQINPDMIATARQRHHLVTRLMLGSVSRKLVCDGDWSMLITPPVHGQ